MGTPLSSVIILVSLLLFITGVLPTFLFSALIRYIVGLYAVWWKGKSVCVNMRCKVEVMQALWASWGPAIGVLRVRKAHMWCSKRAPKRATTLTYRVCIPVLSDIKRKRKLHARLGVSVSKCATHEGNNLMKLLWLLYALKK